MDRMSEDELIRDQIIDVLREGRANPALLRREIDALDSPQQVQSHLKSLRMSGEVNKVCRGLYELDGDNAGGDSA